MADGNPGGWASTSGYGRYIDLLHVNIPATGAPATGPTSTTTVAGSATTDPSSSAPASSAGTTTTVTAKSTTATSASTGGSTIVVAAAGDASCEPGPALDPAVRCAEPLAADAVVQ